MRDSVPGVTVVIPAFNHGDFIGEAIRSCYNQEQVEVEVIVVDDGSSDRTSEVVRTFKNVKYVFQSNAGAHSALNRGIKMSSNSFVSVLNDDDFYEPFHLKNSIEAINRYDLGFVMSNFNIISSDEEHRLSRHSEKANSIISNVGFSSSFLQINPIISSSSFVFRKDITRNISFRPFRICNDLDYILQVLNLRGVYSGYLHIKSWNYRLHDNNSTDSISLATQKIETACTIILSFINSGKKPHWESLSIDHGISKKLFLEIAKDLLNNSKSISNTDVLTRYISSKAIEFEKSENRK